MEEVLQKDPKIFFLNNLLMSVQFFENYDRDVDLLRQNWFKEFSIESQKKKCFYADSLFRLVGRNVKFSSRHEKNKNFASQLHPFRIYISSENVEAACDPSALKRDERMMEPQYQFTVKSAEDSEKSGFVTLVEFKSRDERNTNKRPFTTPNTKAFSGAVNSYESTRENSRSVFPQKLPHGELKPKTSGANSSSRFSPSADSAIPANGSRNYTSPEAGLKLKTIQDFRMNSVLTTSQEIPVQCFLIEEVKRKVNSRRTAFRERTDNQKVLNSSAFKGYFCDLLIEKLSEPLHLDLKAVNESIISDEFIIVNQAGTPLYIAPAIPIRDWNKFVVINKKYRSGGKTGQTIWPSNYMQKIINLLPCSAVPSAHSHFFEENEQHEKMWTLVFPKAEEFLLLHMMHAHIRCYLFVLLIYKSFIESKISGASLGPKHLMHLLFWRVHKNFFAWPEDRPAETLMNYLRVLYKKLQNKSLSDFFITSRNLFAGSLSKDLHKAQTLIKRIIENPVLYITSALRNLELESNYYPGFEILRLKTILNPKNTTETSERVRKRRGQNRVHNHEDEKSLGKKNAIKRMEMEHISGLPKELAGVEEMLDFKLPNFKKCNQILEIFISHFVQMGIKSLEYNFLSQALLYLNHSEKLFNVIASNEINQNNLNTQRKKLTELKEACYSKLKIDFSKLKLSKQVQRVQVGPHESCKTVNLQVEEERKCKNSFTEQMEQHWKETISSDEDENEVVTAKL